jgi:membrane-associated phospholipid phosphatase
MPDPERMTGWRRHVPAGVISITEHPNGWSAWLARYSRDWFVVVAIGTLALLAFAKVGEDVFAHESTPFDSAIQSWVLSHQSAVLDTFFLWMTRLGGIAPMSTVAIVGAVVLWYRERRHVAAHATASTAICCTLAYVYWREGFVRRRVALLFAVIVPLLVGLSRVYLNVHWATDVLGGWSAGLLIAALSAFLYDRHRHRRGQMAPNHELATTRPVT